MNPRTLRRLSPQAFVPILGLLLLLAGSFASRLRAHEVIWWGNPFGFQTKNPLVIYVYDDTRYPDEGGEYDADGVVTPSADEPCIVEVNLDPQTSTLVRASLSPTAFFSSTGVGNEVEIIVDVLRAPNGGDESASVSGEWHATGLPVGQGCDAVQPHPFTIPVRVQTRRIPWKTLMPVGDSFWVDTGFPSTLRWAPAPTGPWVSVGIGQQFLVCADMPTGFFERKVSLGGFLSGSIKDGLGLSVKNYDIGLIYGGANTKTDLNGFFSLPRLPRGDSLITVSNSSGANLNIVVAPNAAEFGTIFAALEAAQVPPAAPKSCHCAPWCAIGFAEISGKRTPVYFGGGATTPTDGSPECTDAQVTVTPPKGPSFTISPGRANSHNSGPIPAPGVWTVTTVVCGITKSASVTVP